MRIELTSVFVDDQRKAHTFYTEVLGFVTKHELPLGDDLWLTLTCGNLIQIASPTGRAA